GRVSGATRLIWRCWARPSDREIRPGQTRGGDGCGGRSVGAGRDLLSAAQPGPRRERGGRSRGGGCNDQALGRRNLPLLAQLPEPAAFYEAPRIGPRDLKQPFALGGESARRKNGRVGRRDHYRPSERIDRLAVARWLGR